MADFQLYGDNDDLGPTSATLKQDATFQGQAYIRYKATESLALYTGVSYTGGGRTEVNGVKQNDRIETSHWRAGAQYFIGPTVQVIAAVGSDISVHNGLKENFRLNLRILKAF